MGDSAGGGLALVPEQQLREHGRSLPERLVLLSPWLDAEVRIPGHPQFQRADPTQR